MKKFFILMGCLVILEVMTIVGFAMSSMGDAPLSKSSALISGFFHGLLTYVFSFPMVLFNSDAPFFLDASILWITVIALFNNALLSLIIIGIIGVLKQRNPKKISN